MYGKIFFLIILCKKVLSEDEEIHEKYIDLLPEEEKQEFLNRIARRILERIKSDNIPNESHADITDDQLDAQDSFVKEILKDESENFKNNMRQTDNQEVESNQQVQLKVVERNDKIDGKVLLNLGGLEEIIESQQRLSDSTKADEIVGLQDNDDRTDNIDDRAKFNDGNKDEHIDGALFEGKRQKRKDGTSNIEAEITTDISYDVIPVKTIYGQEKDDVEVINELGNISVSENIKSQEEQEGNSTNRNEKIKKSESSNSSNVLASSNLIISDSFNDTDKINDLENLRRDEITVSNLRNSSNIEISNNDLLPKSNKINNSENLRKSFLNKLGSTEIKDFQLSDSEFKISPDHDMNNDTTPLPTVSPVITARREKIYVKEDQQKTTKLIYDSTNNEVLPTKLNEVTVSVHNSETSKFYNSSPKTSIVTLENPKEVVHKMKRDSALTKGEVNKNHSGEVNELKNGAKEQFDNKKILRARSDDDSSQKDEYEPSQIAEDSKNVKVYEVYEVGSAQPHFISTGGEKQNENPLYVPVYNYAPENAYFKPYNKFGPNVEDMKKTDIPEIVKEEYSFKMLPNTRNRFSGYGYNKKESTYDKKTYETNLNNNKKAKSLADDFMKTLKEKLINHNIYFNAHDYADLDYYYGRILRRDERRKNEYNKKPQIHKKNENEDENNYEKFIPASNDVQSSIHKSDKMKDNLRAIRKILYLKNHIGYVPKANENVVRNTNLYSETSDKPKKDSIAIDYYFGRADSDENPIYISNVVHQLKNQSIKKESNSDFSPLTPNPLNFDDISKNLPIIKTVIVDRDSYSISQEISDVHFEKLFEALLAVLKDCIQVKNEDLVKYDWLKTTVNIQAAMRKLLDLIKQLKYGEYIHPKDLELIKYTIYIFKSSKTTLDQESKNRDLNKIKSSELQRAKKKNSFQIPIFRTNRVTKIKEPIKLWKNFATFLTSDEIETEKTKFTLLDDFEDLLREILFSLHNLHDTIKHIATITEYKNQNWLRDLKDLYLGEENNKNLAQVLLHLGLSKLLDSIEDSSAHGVEDNFRSFVKKNREDVKKGKEECLFVLKILKELQRMEH